MGKSALLCQHEDLSSNSRIDKKKKSGMAAHVCNPNPASKTGRSQELCGQLASLAEIVKFWFSESLSQGKKADSDGEAPPPFVSGF